MKNKFGVLAVVSGIIVLIDQLTKFYVHTHFKLYEQFTVIPAYFDITYARNTGAAFSFLAHSAQNFREPFFLIIPVAAMVAIVWILKGTASNQKVQIFALSLIFGGALGNYIDRLRLGFVVDFLDFHWREVYHFAAFNVADSAICIGVALLLLQRMARPQSAIDERPPKTTEPTGAPQ